MRIYANNVGISCTLESACVFGGAGNGGIKRRVGGERRTMLKKARVMQQQEG